MILSSTLSLVDVLRIRASVRSYTRSADGGNLLFLHPEADAEYRSCAGRRLQAFLIDAIFLFDSSAIAQIGFEALHKATHARRAKLFERVIAAGRADAAVHAALGYACVRLDDKSAAFAAAEKRWRSIRETCAR